MWEAETNAVSCAMFPRTSAGTSVLRFSLLVNFLSDYVLSYSRHMTAANDNFDEKTPVPENGCDETSC